MPSFTIDALTTSVQILNFKENGEILASGSLVTTPTAVDLAGNNAMFINNGTAISRGQIVVGGLGTFVTVINNGFMSSLFPVISLQNTGLGTCTITNTGVILGTNTAASAISVGSGGLFLTNTGTITTRGDPAVSLAAGVAAEANTIINTGLISNTLGFSIAGASDADSITNTGTIIGDIQLGDGANRLRNGGSIEGNATAGAGNDVIDLRGGFVSGIVNTGAGNDTLIGGAADDRMAGGLGIDRMAGGAAADVFDFNTITTSVTGARDVITDFLRGADDIDLATIDARANLGGNQAFVFIGAAAFSAQGQVRIIDQGANVVVQANRSGTLSADFEVMVLGVGTLAASDFVL